MITVQCIHCAKEFGTYPYRRDSAKFCSKECATKHNQKPTIICPTCKKAFIRKKPEMKYCSHECACVESRNRVDFTCLVCGKPFERRCSDVARGQGVYCSPECLSVSQTRKVETQCAQCGKVFEFSPSADKKFCSPECYWQSLGEPRREYECKQCHRLFVAHPAEKRKFCTHACYLLHRGRTSIEQRVHDLLVVMGLAFCEQKRIGSYPCDFFLTSYNIIIEADGDYWHSLPKNQERDERKDRYLSGRGYIVIRLPEHRINDDLEWCKTQIASAISIHS